MLQTPSTGGARRDSLPFSETGSLGDANTSPVVEFFREEVKEEAPPPAPAAPAKASPRQAARKNSMNAGFLNNPKKKNR